MAKYILLITVFISLNTFGSDEKKLMLTETTIGGMPIEVGKEISLYKIRKYFSFYRVTQEICEGDSPDYNLFLVSTHEGEEQISFISYIDEKTGYENSVVLLDKVVIHGSLTVDEYGVYPGMNLNQAIEKRKDVKFGAGHMDNYVGNGKIWYLFSVGNTHGEQVSESMAQEENPNIDVISWPVARWR